MPLAIITSLYFAVVGGVFIGMLPIWQSPAPVVDKAFWCLIFPWLWPVVLCSMLYRRRPDAAR